MLVTFLNMIFFLDLQFSSEEEFDEVPLSDGEGDENKMSILVSAEVPPENVPADDDSQQAAEAMMQLGNIGFYQQTDQTEIIYKGIFNNNLYIYYFIKKKIITEESMDVDPNYDPSDFLMVGLPKSEVLHIKPDPEEMKIHDDLAVSESEEECNTNQQSSSHQIIHEEDDGGDLWFQIII